LHLSSSIIAAAKSHFGGGAKAEVLTGAKMGGAGIDFSP
jgi:hypothetical protein